MISHACGSRTLRSNLMARPLSHRNLCSPTRVRRRNRDASSFPREKKTRGRESKSEMETGSVRRGGRDTGGGSGGRRTER
ncbi:hypothetical protein ALC60_10680 [Trachymyrmex zeteki]|uniref:Uncharacterized protein n=1 Tax=Mycetomoellerius zeteki TaxID=64791 RepID=A0A151WQT3_9HYME|nr:hypothetical protein ALC60_10680 [Trachymyrmex zeteki]